MANEFTKLAVRHPVSYAVGVGVIFTVLLLTIFGAHPGASVVFGVVFGVANWILWRPGGLAARSQKDVPEGPVRTGMITRSVVIGAAIFGVVFVALRLML